MEKTYPNALPESCPCHCEEEGCGWEGIIADCPMGTDSEGWEHPEYDVLLCPKCREPSIMF